MKNISQAEVDGMRRFIASERTSEDLKKSFKAVLDKYKISINVPFIEDKNSEKENIMLDIEALKSLIAYSSEEEKVMINSDIKDLQVLLKYT
tara:strand:- start:32 stop:307 length:276 start_codon:yes stop_codon:yes gene_type:complete